MALFPEQLATLLAPRIRHCFHEAGLFGNVKVYGDLNTDSVKVVYKHGTATHVMLSFQITNKMIEDDSYFSAIKSHISAIADHIAMQNNKMIYPGKILHHDSPPPTVEELASLVAIASFVAKLPLLDENPSIDDPEAFGYVQI